MARKKGKIRFVIGKGEESTLTTRGGKGRPCAAKFPGGKGSSGRHIRNLEREDAPPIAMATFGANGVGILFLEKEREGKRDQHNPVACPRKASWEEEKLPPFFGGKKKKKKTKSLSQHKKKKKRFGGVLPPKQGKKESRDTCLLTRGREGKVFFFGKKKRQKNSLLRQRLSTNCAMGGGRQRTVPYQMRDGNLFPFCPGVMQGERGNHGPSGRGKSLNNIHYRSTQRKVLLHGGIRFLAGGEKEKKARVFWKRGRKNSSGWSIKLGKKKTGHWRKKQGENEKNILGADLGWQRGLRLDKKKKGQSWIRGEKKSSNITSPKRPFPLKRPEEKFWGGGSRPQG